MQKLRTNDYSKESLRIKKNLYSKLSFDSIAIIFMETERASYFSWNRAIGNMNGASILPFTATLFRVIFERRRFMIRKSVTGSKLICLLFISKGIISVIKF